MVLGSFMKRELKILRNINIQQKPAQWSLQCKNIINFNCTYLNFFEKGHILIEQGIYKDSIPLFLFPLYIKISILNDGYKTY